MHERYHSLAHPVIVLFWLCSYCLLFYHICLVNKDTHNVWNSHVTITTPLLWVICRPVARIDIAYLCTKLDDFAFCLKTDTDVVTLPLSFLHKNKWFPRTHREALFVKFGDPRGIGFLRYRADRQAYKRRWKPYTCVCRRRGQWFTQFNTIFINWCSTEI